MTGDKIAFMPAMVGRIIVFVFTLAIGLAVSYLIPAFSREAQTPTTTVTVEEPRHHCPH